MRTYLFEGKVTALSSITHNGGEHNGITTQLRRETFIMPNGETEEVPVISGNSIRGRLRDIGMYYMLQKLGYGIDVETGEIKGLSLPAFYFLFSGGALTAGSNNYDIGYFRQMKKIIPLIALFGGAVGNMIMPGKIKIGKMIPICEETNHIIPDKYKIENAKSIWDYTQIEMYTRKDDEKNDNLRGMLTEVQRGLLGDGGEITKKANPQQMMYYTETIASGTNFYWKIILEDVTDIEFDAFLTTLMVFSKSPYIGGRSNIGLGEISIKFEEWVEINSRIEAKTDKIDKPLGKKYEEYLKNNKNIITKYLEKLQ